MSFDHLYAIYILSSKRNGTLYIGVTSNLPTRIFEHKEKILRDFTSQYNVSHLVYYEFYQDIREAIHREKQLKKWKREWKLRLIEKHNPRWRDLYDDGEILPLPMQQIEK